MPRGPGTPTQREAVAAAHAAGKGRNEIARDLGISLGTVTNIAHHLGLTFDRAGVQQATDARKADCAARRAALEATYLQDAEKLRAQLWLPHEYIDHGGKEFVEVRWTQPEPSPSDKLKLMQASRAALDGSLKITQLEAASGDEPVKALLVELGRALGIVDQEPAADAGD